MQISKEDFENEVTKVMARQGEKIADITDDSSVVILVGLMLSDSMCMLRDSLFKEEK